MAHAKRGDLVRVHYTGRLEDGTVFDTSDGGDPIEFTIGEGQVIPGFEDLVVGMAVGDARSRTIPAGEAYGERRLEMVIEVPRESCPDGVEVGGAVEIGLADGRRLGATIVDVAEESVTLDANHPLAGRDLTFDVRLVEVLDA